MEIPFTAEPRQLYPVVIRQVNSEPSWEIPPDLADVPALDLRIADDEKKRYFLIGNVESPSPKKAGRRVLVVMPGGDGSAAFSPFIRRIYPKDIKRRMGDRANRCSEMGERPKRCLAHEISPFSTARFSTEQLFDEVMADVAARCLMIALRFIFLRGLPVDRQPMPSR